jgi:predicted lipoprotein with Yx(FWY)xxD motif
VPTSHIQRVGGLTTLHAATASVNGRSQSILVNAKGLPLYYFQGDTAKKSNVSGVLLRLWPALVSAHPVGTGTPGKLTALQSANGHQVTYNGRFLYTFIDDTPGQVTGQGVSGFFVATPHLKAINGSTTTAPPASSSASHGYGY